MSQHQPQRETKKASTKHAAREQRRALQQGIQQARHAELERRGVLTVRRPPRTDAERATLRTACREKAKLEGFTGRRGRERAEAIYAEVVAEAQRQVRLVTANDRIIVTPKAQGEETRSPTGVLYLPGGPGLVRPP